MTSYYDNTRVSTYRECPRKFYLRHVNHWRSEGTALALVNGLAWHDAMDVIWSQMKNKSDSDLHKMALAAYVQTWVKEGLPEPADMTMEQMDAFSPRGPHIASETLMNYILQRREFIENGELLAFEKPFAVPLGADDEIMYIGRLDKVFKHKVQGTLVIEHKTTSAYAKAGGFRPTFVDSFSPNSQVDGYSHAAHMLYENVRGIWVDAALFHKTVHDKFKFIPVDRQFAMLDAWLQETRNWIERIENDKESFKTRGLAGTYPKNTGACSNFAGCSFRDVCRFHDNPADIEVPSGYVVEEWSPFDVLKIEKLGLKPEGKDG